MFWFCSNFKWFTNEKEINLWQNWTKFYWVDILQLKWLDIYENFIWESFKNRIIFLYTILKLQNLLKVILACMNKLHMILKCVLYTTPYYRCYIYYLQGHRKCYTGKWLLLGSEKQQLVTYIPFAVQKSSFELTAMFLGISDPKYPLTLLYWPTM